MITPEKVNRILILFFLFLLLSLLILILIYNIYNLDHIRDLRKEVSSFEVVVARYNEDLYWIAKEFPNEKITVYNKGEDNLKLPDNCTIIKLPNIGRESHTYLYHIINNYNNLSDRVLFLQGTPYTMQKFTITPLNKYKKIGQTQCKNIIAGLCEETNIYEESEHVKDFTKTKYRNTIFKNYDFVEYFKEYINPDEENIYFSYNANFAVDKNKILLNNIEYYQKIFNTLDNVAPVEGHYLERSWDTIFGEKPNNKS